MIVALLLFACGLLLSAFFSGSETGFYRVNRLRLVLDAMGGDFVSRGMLALTNHPSIFVATVLVGNNLANYMVSLAVVIGTQLLFIRPDNPWPEIIAPLVLAPFLFVYGELLPKNFFYQAPNRLLRRAGLPLLICTALLLPITVLLWMFSQLLEKIAGESPQRAQLGLARKELQQIFEEGHEAGILRPAQRGLAEGLFAVANRPITSFVIAPGRVARLRQGATRDEILRLARRHRLPALPVEAATVPHKLIGYVRVVDLFLDRDGQMPPIRPLVEIPDADTYLSALMRLESSSESLGHVINPQGQTLGFLTARHLSEPLFRNR